MTHLAKIALIVMSIVGVYFAYRGVTTTAWEGDSLAYHIPIAQNIAAGKFTNFDSLLEYYPASSETLLAILMILGIPLNLYNLVAWGLLFIVCRRLALAAGLKRNMAIVLAAAICLWPSVIRLIPTQTVDVWVALFFVWALALLLKPQLTGSYFLQLGISLGMLIGSKYSGPLFAGSLLLVFGKPLLKAKLNRWMLLVGVIILTGLVWYLRNWYFMGHPLYPAGAPGFRLLNWQLWMTLVIPGGLLAFLEALISEYLIWAFVPLIAWKIRSPLVLLGLVNVGICALLPTWPENIVSDLRYTYAAFIPLIAAVFLWFQSRRRETELSLVAIATSVAVIPQLDYHPKLLVAILLGLGVIVFSAPSRN